MAFMETFLVSCLTTRTPSLKFSAQVTVPTSTHLPHRNLAMASSTQSGVQLVMGLIAFLRASALTILSMWVIGSISRTWAHTLNALLRGLMVLVILTMSSMLLASLGRRRY